MLKARIVTAVILVPIVIAFIFLVDTIWFSALFALIVAIGAWEWAGLSKVGDKLKYSYVIATLAILLTIYWLDSYSLYIGIALAGVVYWLSAIVLIISYQKQRNLLPRNSSILMLVGFLLLIPMWSSLTILKSYSDNGPTLIMLLMLLIWGADTAAYFAGKKWGKRKLAYHVSPGKTWEGTMAGIASSIVIAVCYVIVSNKNSDDSLLFIGLSILTVIASVFGDLMESIVKREAGQKDSGNILPGHGGVMDRIDSLTSASPIFVFGLISTGLIQ
jgi:phosphatidate cytidylyltransferase